ncbi:MAG: chromosome segregation protein SMC [Vampirovibrionia bacterium]
MRIKEIEIDNFKSFRQKTVIPVLDGFTTISGPNGSGKSNIIDCVLFALGLSTSKTLRAEKLTDLINNNNKRREATVRISFTDDTDLNKDFEIKRKIKEGPNGYTSTYYLNDHVTTLANIHNELSTYNISPGSYNVMMQGDVTGIINMGPTERRRIIDELAGVSEFDRRIEQATRELETVQDRIERSNIILSEINVRLEQLSEERSHALKYKDLKDKRQEFIDQISLVKYSDLRKSLKLIQENINDSTKEKSNILKNLDELENKINEAKLTLDKLNETVKLKGEDQQISLTKQVEVLKGEIFRKSQSVEFSQKQIEDNKLTVSRAYKEITKLEENIDDLNLKVESKQEQYNIIEKQLEKENNDLKKLLDESGDLSKAAQQFIEKRSKLKKELELAEDNYGKINRENLKWEDVISRTKNELEELENNLNNSDVEKNYLFELKEKLIKEINNLTEEKDACEKQLTNSINTIKTLKKDLNDLEAKRQKEYRRLMQFEANKKAAEDANFGKAVDVVLNSGIPGIHKTLAQLGKVEKEYSTALETAMGGRMKSIIVDNEHVGAEAIEYLKETRAGRATFLPLNKIKYYVPSCSLPNVDGVIDFAVNLIEFDNIYKNAFYYALGETLVVEDVECAKPLMGEYRMVTLDGALIEKSGAMTGGSIAKSNLKFASDYNDEIKEISNGLKALNAEKDELEDNIEEYERKLDRNRNDYSNYLNEIHKKKIDLENVENTLKNIDSVLENKATKVEELKTKLTEATSQNNSIIVELSGLDTQIKSLQEQISEIDASIPEEKLEQIEELTGNIEFEIKNLETKLRNIEADVKKLVMEKDFKAESLKYQKENIDKSKTDNIKHEEDITSYKTEIKQLESNVEKVNQELNNLSQELKEAQKERDNAAKAVFDMQQAMDKSQHTIQRIEETIVAYNQRRKEVSIEFKSLKEELTEKGIDFSDVKELNITTEEINKSIERLSKKMEALEPVNMLAIKEYDEVNGRKEEIDTRVSTLSTEKEQINDRLSRYESLKKEAFMTTYENVNKNFQEIYAELSDGEGQIVLENYEDPFKGGLTITARPRGKKLLRIEAMSGGEKSLTALAFVFAFQKYLPAPFYAFDEVDMHLDGINVEKLAEMIKTQASNAQFLVVSLRKPMIERADRTIGVTQRIDGITKVTGVKLNA